MRHLPVLQIAAMLTAAVSAAPPIEQLLTDAMNTPIVTVPRVENAAPNVDGVVDDAEWSRAALLPNFVTTSSRRHEGAAPRYRTKVYLQYDGEALYVATKADYPAWAGKPAIYGRKRDESSGRESHFDIFINPTDRETYDEHWHVCGNAGGALFDRLLSDDAVGLSWNPDVTYKARMTDDGWESEFKLPFAALPAAAPTGGEFWRAQFFFIRRKPALTMSTWSPWIDWRPRGDGMGYGWLRFGTDDRAVRFERGFESADRDAPQVRIIGGAGDGRVETFRRNDDFSADHPTMLMNLARWYAERNTGGAAFIGATMPRLIDEVFKRFDPIGEALTGDAIDLPITPELGEYLVRYRFTANDELLAAGAAAYRIRPQISMDLRPMLLTADVINTTVDFANLKQPEKAKTLTLAVSTQDEQSARYETSREIKGMEPLTFAVPGAKMPPGSYGITAAVRDDAGAALAEVSTDFTRPPAPDWWTDPVGKTPAVPKPWTPVEVRRSQGGMDVSMWGRTYRFDGLPVPSEVTTVPARYSTGEQPRPAVSLLAAPMTFRLRAGGEAVALEAQPVTVAETTDDKVVLHTATRAGNIIISGVTTVEFDGMIRVDLDIAPVEGKAAIDELEFVIPFKPEHAVLMGNFGYTPGPGTRMARYLGFLPDLPWKYPVFFAQTIGTDRYGLQWFADDTRGWFTQTPDEAMQLRRADGAIEEVFRLVDHSIELSKSTQITFGLIALPNKPLREDWGTMRITSSSFNPPSPDETEKVAEFKRAAAFVKPDVELSHNPSWSGTPWYPYPFTDPAAQAALKARIDLSHEVGLRWCPHSGWQAISTLIPEWSTFGKEMGIYPETETLGKTVFACYRSPYSQFTAANWKHHAETIGIDGIKADTMFPQTPCASMEHGCGWRDHRSRLHPSVNIFATREFFKQLYNVFHENVKTDGITNAAQTGMPMAAVCSFTDVVFISEGAPYYGAQTIREGYPQDIVRTLMTGALFGVINLHDMKGQPLNAPQRMAALLVAGADPRLMYHPAHYTRSYIKRAPNKYNATSPSVDIWDAWDWIDRGGEAIWMPYWEDENETLRIDADPLPDGATPEVYASMYLQPGKKAIVIATNYELRSVTTRATLDLAALGFAPDVKLHAEDVVTRVPIKVTDGAFDVGVLSERYRIIKVWAGDEPAQFADANLGENLLAGGDFEDGGVSHLRLRAPVAQKGGCFSIDDTRAASGKRSLRAVKVTTDFSRGMGAAYAQFASLDLQPGDYVLQGAVRIDDNLAPPMEGNTPRDNDAIVQVTVDGGGITHDPPRWASSMSGSYIAEEQTPEWDRLLIAFTVPEGGAAVNVSLRLAGVGAAWFDDLSVRRANR